MPGLPDYPLRLYLERVKMWYRLYDGMDETVGPLLAGRLGGRAQKIALSLRLRDPHGNIDVGDAALVRLAVDEVRDPTNPAIVLQEHIVSGVQALFNALVDAFGEGDQLRATQSLENFFDFRRGRLSLAEYSAEWTMRLEEAITHAGLDINAVARTFLYFRGSQLPQRHVDRHLDADFMETFHGFRKLEHWLFDLLIVRMWTTTPTSSRLNITTLVKQMIGPGLMSLGVISRHGMLVIGLTMKSTYDAYDDDEYYDPGEAWPEEQTAESTGANHYRQ